MWPLFSRQHRKSSPGNSPCRTRAPRFEPLEARLALATYNVDNNLDGGLGSLRYAIEQANSTPGVFDLIKSNLSGSQTIVLHSALPPLTDRVRIEGSSFTDKMVIDGSAIARGAYINGLLIEEDFCELRYLVVQNFPGAGIFIDDASFNIVYDSEIRFNDSAQSRLDPGTPGIAINARSAGGASRNTVRNNLIHHNSFGMGIGYGASDNTIEDNTIEDNLFDGIFLFADGDGIQFASTSRNVMRGNTIQRNANGIVIAGGVDPPINNGVNLGATGNRIENNIAITANRENGVLIDGVKAIGNVVRSNTAINDNLGHGVRLSGGANGNTIGGTSSGQGNTIHDNHGDGVMVQNAGYEFFPNPNGPPFSDYIANGAAINNSIRANDIFGNWGLPIDLRDDGVTSNDLRDPDTGPNQLQNFPVINVAHSGANTYVSGSLNSLPGTWFQLDLYASSAAGQRYLGRLEQQTDASGNVGFEGLLLIGGGSGRATVAGETLFATATDPSGNTSEYSPPITVSDLVVTGTAANDTFLIQEYNVFFADVLLNGVSQGRAAKVFVDAWDGSDSYTVNFGGWGGDPNVIVSLSDTGAVTDTDALTVNGTAAADSFNKQPGFVQWKPTGQTLYQARVNYAGIEPFTLNMNLGNDTVIDPGTDTTILGGEGDDTIIINATSGNGVVADGGDGSDTYIVTFGSLAGPVTIADTGSVGSDSLTVQGTAGDDAITLTATEVHSGAERVIIAGPLESLVVNAGEGSDSMSLVDFTAPITSLGLDGGGGTNTVSVSGSLPPGVDLDIVGATQSVQIDILRSGVNLASSGTIAVAVYSTASFDAMKVAADSVVFAGAHAVSSALADADGDGDLDMVLHFRTQETNLLELYAQLLADDLNGDGTLDSSHKELGVALTGQTVDDLVFGGFDAIDLFLSGKSLRGLLEELAVAGAIYTAG